MYESAMFVLKLGLFTHLLVW